LALSRDRPYESQEHSALWQWCQLSFNVYPELRLLYHIPNGERRSPKDGAKLKRMGVRPGIPDWCLPVARGSFHGLYIEMKRLGASLNDHQRYWFETLQKQGYRCEIAKGWEAGREILIQYLSLK
jgi:hypothetical protein